MGELQMRGQAPDAIQEALDAAWASGELQAPGRPGINYMLSPRNHVPIGPDTVIPYGPHLMFYAPHLSDADVGGDLTAAGFKIKIDETADIAGNARLAARTITLESCVDGSLLARFVLRFVQTGRVQSCVRPVDAVSMTAGPNAIREIGSQSITRA